MVVRGVEVWENRVRAILRSCSRTEGARGCLDLRVLAKKTVQPPGKARRRLALLEDYTCNFEMDRRPADCAKGPVRTPSTLEKSRVQRRISLFRVRQVRPTTVRAKLPKLTWLLDCLDHLTWMSHLKIGHSTACILERERLATRTPLGTID